MRWLLRSWLRFASAPEPARLPGPSLDPGLDAGAHRGLVLVALALGVVLFDTSGSALDAQVRYREDESTTQEQADLRADMLGRSVEVFALDCVNDYYRREITLFGNGTIRVKEGYLEAPEMWLGELDRYTTDALIEQLQRQDLREVEPTSRTVVGDWVETCTFTLDLPGEDTQVFTFRRLDALSLPLQKALSVAITTLGMIDRTRPPSSRSDLPRGYIPQIGDVLVAADGREFRVHGFTTGNVAVELIGVEQPVVLYVSVTDLGGVFISRRDDPSR